MTWRSSAQALLDAAEAAALSAPLKRVVLAPGPSFARDCRMIAVYLETVVAVAIGATDELPRSGCALVPVVNLRLVFADDCVPVPGDSGTPPTPEAISTWSGAFLDDAESIWNAVADAAAAGSLGDCSGVTIGQLTPTGPSGRMATVQIPVRLLSI
jgi:hypothetical protein